MSLELPAIYLLTTNLRPDELHALEDRIPSLTWNPREADIIVGKITRRERALFELRRLKLPTSAQPAGQADVEPPAKRPRLTGSAGGQGDPAMGGTIKVVKLSWLTDTLERGTVLPTEEYVLFEGQKVSSPGDGEVRGATFSSHDKRMSSGQPGSASTSGRAADATASPPPPLVAGELASTARGSRHPRRLASHPPPILHETTSEHDDPLPPVPDYLHTKYSCQRPNPIDTPNVAFIEQLKKVRTLRLLEDDQVGVRAYSSAISTIAAYPYPVRRPFEISRLPGCGTKIAELFLQWKDTGSLSEVVASETDERLRVLRIFYDIWGVGSTTAREFYNKGWRDLDDLVEHAWGSLSRVQQIGIKYYDEFQLKIPRAEVESIGRAILSECRKLDAGYQMTIVGGYRRGKTHSGDVDVVLSHKDEARTLRLIDKLVSGLEKSRYITHTLSLGTRNSERGQVPLPWRGTSAPRGLGFDTLDKALVVWQDPGRDNPPHRRVDIIVSPWKTVGCAVLGWSGGTTFQRDLRRYCKEQKGFKFDSSGVRNRADGSWVDLEGTNEDAKHEPAPDMDAAERRVFTGLGLTWRPPHERCTG